MFTEWKASANPETSKFLFKCKHGPSPLLETPPSQEPETLPSLHLHSEGEVWAGHAPGGGLGPEEAPPVSALLSTPRAPPPAPRPQAGVVGLSLSRSGRH